MERPVRIAVVGPVDDRLVGELRQLPLRPEVRACVGLAADSEAVLRFQPDLITIALAADAGEEIGALRLLRQLWPALGVLVVAAPDAELATTPLAARLRARLLVYPSPPGQLAAAIEQARQGSDRPTAEAFVDLARGVADEINNPLMFASGHLQLLRASFEAKAESARRDQITQVQAGMQRIQEAVDRLRLLAQAANGPRRAMACDLAAMLATALATPPAGAASGVTVATGDGGHTVQGDHEQLAAALAAIVQLAAELATTGVTSGLFLDHLPGGQRLRLVASGAALHSWQLPHSFEPYYPSRALRGQSAGLGLFLAQTVVLGHRGQATVQRLADGTLQFDFVLPA
ncbi:MAG: HAMP domain-containing histidine kinase [Planctomycetes bacterium]|nr:HAMP domain-containing histidine kinase [Planctomycetota bacterium]